MTQRSESSQKHHVGGDDRLVSDLFTSIIGFQVHPGREADFVDAFLRTGMLERPRSIEGFVCAELLQQHDDETSFTVIGKWRSPGAYAEWGRKSQEGADEDALRTLAECVITMFPGRLFKRAY